MSHIQSMAILGIRSFSPEEPSYIKFFSPLTLIVGSNGSGKTTIIESLRYACTGDFPPNSKGGAFVNDPKIAGTNEVKAQIRLKFYNINGQKMICSRSLAVTQKKATITQKSIDNALLRYDATTGETFSITSRCADMDAELPLHLGVPKAILDNVIFCHQEESNWPLSEPSILKKKFDDIFSSKRYQVALENIKDIRKESTQEIRVNTVRLEALKADAAKAKKVRSTLTQMNQQLMAKTETLQTIESKIERVDQDSQRLIEALRSVELTADQIQQIINKKDFYTSTMQSIESHITPRSESTEQLIELLRQHHIKEGKNQEEKSTIAQEKSQLERRLKQVQEALSQKHLVMGRLEAAREEHERQIQARSTLIKKINDTQDLDLPVEDGSASATVLKRLLQERAVKNEKEKDNAMARQNELSDELQLLKSRALSIRENKKHLNKLIEQDKAQIERIDRSLKEYQVSSIELESVKSKIAEYNRKMEEMEAKSTESSQDDIVKKERELRDLDDRISDLNDEMTRLSKQGDTRAKLSLKRGEKEVKETTLNQIYNDRIADVESLLGSRPSIENLQKELDIYKTDKERQLATLIEIRNKANRELSASQAKLTMAKQNYDNRKAEADELSATIRAVCKNANVPTEIALTEKKIESWKEKISQVEGAQIIYAKYSTAQQSSNCCPVCIRDFKNDSEVKAFEAQLQKMQEFIPGKLTTLKGQLKQLEDRKAKYKSVHGTWIKLDTLNKELESMKTTLTVFESEKMKAINKADVAATELVEVDNCKIKADNLLQIAGNANRLYKEVEALKQDIQIIEDELKFSGSTRTLSDVQKELEELADKSKSVRRDIKRIHADVEVVHRQKQSIMHALNESQKKLMALEHSRDIRVGFEIQLKELQEQMQTRIHECQEIDKDTGPLDEKTQEASRAYEEAVKSWRVVEEKASLEEREVSRFSERLDEFNAQILRSAATTSSQKIDSLKKEISDLQAKTKEITDKIAKTDEKLAIIEKDEAERRGVERDLQDQIKYREMQEDLKQCEQELKVLQEKQGDVDVIAIKRELNKTRSEESDLLDKRGSVRGEIVQLRDQIRRYETELSTDYADVDGRYGRLYIEVKTNELANSDLEKYSKVLQTAIMKYHSLKMQDLNKLIKELWIDTYKGGDIDYIEIRADNEGSTAARSFNYRVVMIQNGSELNMRGRCSAGQKVLAAIIIRLALAETFSVNCGIFTLDEPTTNLDRDNIESLAENLARIIKNRSQQSNFQFVIITHDEEFVEYLSRADILGQYYRVQKDHEQHSIISLQGETEQAIGGTA